MRDEKADRDNETEMEKRWRKLEGRIGKKCQQWLTKLNLSSKWPLNKRLRQQNEIIHAHTHAGVPSSHALLSCASRRTCKLPCA